jgi:hypothetical protein
MQTTVRTARNGSLACALARALNPRFYWESAGKVGAKTLCWGERKAYGDRPAKAVLRSASRAAGAVGNLAPCVI